MGTLYNGTSGADTLSETTFTGDTLVGGAGDDTYYCWASSYWVSGLPGYTEGYDVYYRTDVVEQASQGYDTVHYHMNINGIVVSGSELPSIERIYLINDLGTSGTFQLSLGDGAQQVFGSTLGETISGGAGDDTLSGMAGNDSLVGGDGPDSLLGGSGNDTLDGGANADHMAGGKGNDVYYLQNIDVVTEAAGEGIDVAHASVSHTLGPNIEQLVLGAGNINGTGNTGNNWLYAGAGNNILTGGGGTDTVSFKLGVALSGVTASLATGLATGGSGTDTMYGISNIEGTLYYADSLEGKSGGNRLIGLGGNDSLNGGTGADTLIGGAGNDEYRVDNTGDSVRENVNEGTDKVVATVSHTLRVNVENLQLDGNANIDGRGNDANNEIIGNTGNNALTGNAGADFLNGWSGNDTLIGGAGYDQLTGDTGADRFRFDTVTDATASGIKDLIRDFQSGIDRIDLSRIDAYPNIAGDQAFSVDDMAYDPGTGILYADVGGNGTYDLQLQLGLSFHPLTVLVADLIL